MNRLSRSIIKPGEHKKNSFASPLIEVTKIYNAPVEKVFQAWSTPKLIEQWWSSLGTICPLAQADFRPGGEYLFAMQKINNPKRIIWSAGTYLQIIPHRLIQMSDLPVDHQGSVIDSINRRAYITVEFESRGPAQTLVRLSHEGLPSVLHDDCVEAWRTSLDRIQALVEMH